MIYDFNKITPKRIYTYGGKSGSKLAFFWNNEIWFLKFPQNLRNQKTTLSYSFSPISEYIGSHIYSLLNFNTHKTELGIYQNKVVVACKDFNENEKHKFYEFKNLFNNPLKNDSSEFSENSYDINSIMEIIEENFDVSIIENTKQYFWDMFVVDSFINNKDRNNGNWGYFTDLKGNFIDFSPIYDNGSSFFPKNNTNSLLTKEFMKSKIYNGKTPFSINGKNIDSISTIRRYPNYLKNEEYNNYLKKSIIKIVPRIQKNLNLINEMIENIEEEKNGIVIISKKRKEIYKYFLEKRLNIIFIPTLKKLLN